MQILCRLCGLRREVEFFDLPTERVKPCQNCAALAWISAEEPKREYALSFQDRRFLRSLHIDPEDLISNLYRH